ncbi:ImmA/IrrE family metallo-endopeptidase [Myroides odoratimimus]|uniref:ImmA/IrrE family metallo-endopeptidase n=1 Tax=Myroides odoratimimus TaxID=76832 RepID=UPI002DC03A2F|nr:ImmA/IrrE family metallo-endopeptidase [Myroides odoratimimus]MEC4041899.1 ImmA/IrrE family metallo-endopeptidase [Myroides odoratimimus]MEC4149869.1 ImmA/IrrE family metallo-endopeptidase [Myroides odoratimimus]
MAVNKDIINKINDFISNNKQFFEEAPIKIYSLIESQQINIKEHTFDDDITGVLIIDKENDKATIGINPIKNNYVPRKNFTLAHELGHFVLHNDLSNTFVDKIFFRKKSEGYTTKEEKIEKEANHFAASILMPDFLIKKEIQSINHGFLLDDDEKTIQDLADKFSVSKPAMLYRLINLGII